MEEEQVNRLIQHIDARFAQVDARFEQIDRRFDQIDGRFEQVDGRFEQVDGRFEQVDGRFEHSDAQFEQIATRFEQVDAQIAESRRHAEIIAEGLRHEIRLVAEGVDTANERIDRLDTTMKDEFADVRTLIHVSSAALDQRVSKLESSSRR